MTLQQYYFLQKTTCYLLSSKYSELWTKKNECKAGGMHLMYSHVHRKNCDELQRSDFSPWRLHPNDNNVHSSNERNATNTVAILVYRMRWLSLLNVISNKQFVATYCLSWYTITLAAFCNIYLFTTQQMGRLTMTRAPFATKGIFKIPCSVY